MAHIRDILATKSHSQYLEKIIGTAQMQKPGRSGPGVVTMGFAPEIMAAAGARELGSENGRCRDACPGRAFFRESTHA
jgi:hypothetical protein